MKDAVVSPVTYAPPAVRSEPIALPKFFTHRRPLAKSATLAQIPAAAMAGGDRSKRTFGFADDVKSSPQATAEVMGTRRIHGEVAGIADPLALIERAGSLQHDGRDLPLALAHMGLEARPERSAVPPQKTGSRAGERDQDGEAD